MIINAWDNVNPTEAAKLRMLANIRTASPQKRAAARRVVPALAGIAVVAAVAVLAIPTLRGADVNPATTVAPAQTATEPGSVADAPASPGTALYPLTLNRGEVGAYADAAYPADVFEYELTDEQLAAVFPNLPLTLTATALYTGEGKLMNLSAVETLTPHGYYNPVQFAEGYYRTQITLGEGEIREDCVIVYDADAVVSEVYGVPVTAVRIGGDGKSGVTLFQATFKLGNVAYRVELHDSYEGDGGETRLTELVNAIIANGAADLGVLADPVIPEYRHEALSLEGARDEADFGAYLPESAPAGFGFEFANRTVNQREDCLTAHWGRENAWFQWQVSGREYAAGFDDGTLFTAEEISLDAVKALAFYREGDSGDIDAWRVELGVLYDGVCIGISAKGVSPEEVWDLISAVIGG
jgi:hypothetical protein